MNRRKSIVLASASLVLAAGLAAGWGLLGLPGVGQSSGGFPSFVYYLPEGERGYRLATEQPRLFSQLACYCGCGAFADEPHRNLLDCFMEDDGSFEPHASGCSLCLDIAFDGVEWQAQGKSPAEVQLLVDEEYATYGPRTRQEVIPPVD